MSKHSAYLSRVETLFEDGRTKSYPKHQIVNYHGDPLTDISFVKKGYLKAYTILDTGDTRTIMILGPGDIFPLAFSHTMDWENYTVQYFYQSLTDVKLQLLDSKTLKQHIDNDPELMSTYMSYMAASNQIITKQLEIMKSKTALSKVGLMMPYLILKMGEKVKPHVYRLRIKLSHQEIADLSGVTRETITTLFKTMEHEGKIDHEKGKIIIHTDKEDEEQLEET